MNQRATKLFFALLRSAVNGEKLEEKIKSEYSDQTVEEIEKLASMHDLSHLIIFALKNNQLLTKDKEEKEKTIFTAVFREEKSKFELELLIKNLEKERIDFIPLKGSVTRKYYPEAWMRTSCDIDVLVRKEQLKRATDLLVKQLNYKIKERATHDVAFISPRGNTVELHFDLIEEGRAKNAEKPLGEIWEKAKVKSGYNHYLEMPDNLFYLYHVAHMAKHFEEGGCGTRPFIDLYLLDTTIEYDLKERNELLEKAQLLVFAEQCRKLSKVWLENIESNQLLDKMEEFIVTGGVYGNAENRVSVKKSREGGKVRYIFSRIFVPYDKLKRYYPILEKHPLLTPFMQVKRWFMLLRPSVYKMAKKEMELSNKSNKNINSTKEFLENIGL